MVLLAESSLVWGRHGLERLAAEHKRVRESHAAGVVVYRRSYHGRGWAQERKEFKSKITIKGSKRVRLDRKGLLY
jgi:hypothetical protein